MITYQNIKCITRELVIISEPVGFRICLKFSQRGHVFLLDWVGKWRSTFCCFKVLIDEASLPGSYSLRFRFIAAAARSENIFLAGMQSFPSLS